MSQVKRKQCHTLVSVTVCWRQVTDRETPPPENYIIPYGERIAPCTPSVSPVLCVTMLAFTRSTPLLRL